MSPPKEKIWPIDEHTKGKHLVLRAYLNAWLPILGSWNGRILFIDSFAGPGEYKDGEEGSPVIALNALINHSSKNTIRGEINFLFIESREDRYLHLNEIVKGYENKLPTNASAQAILGSFDEAMKQVLDQVEEQNKNLAPSFVMIDPFSISDTPLSVIERLLRNPRSEVFISVMYEFINRFIRTPEFEKHLDELFGCKEWRNAVDISDSGKRKKFLFDLYINQLKKAGCKYVVNFDLYEGNRHVYTIFFGTQHLKGCDEMKKAIWKIVPSGNYRFVGTNSPQLTLSINSPNYDPLKKILQDRFIGKGWIGIEEIIDFVVSDETDYHSGQVKTTVLKPMEKNKEIECKDRTRDFTYPEGTKIKFLDNN
jgi:three-Cys-motif partner protein